MNVLVRDEGSTLVPGALQTTSLESNPACHLLVQTVIWEHSHTLQWQSWVTATEIPWPTELTGPFYKKFANFYPTE